MAIAYLGLGSNVNPEHNLRAGIRALHETFMEVACSPVYRSRAVGFDGDDFLNLAARVITDLPPLAVKDELTRIEDAHGRLRDVPKFSDRSLDIDLLLYDDLILDDPRLILPRAEVMEYAHVLRPLADLAPDVVHPVAGERLAVLWGEMAKGESDGLELVELE